MMDWTLVQHFHPTLVMVYIDGTDESRSALKWALRYFSPHSVTLLSSSKVSAKFLSAMTAFCNDICPRAHVHMERLSSKSGKGPLTVQRSRDLNINYLVLPLRKSSALKKITMHKGNKHLNYCIQHSGCQTFGVRKEKGGFQYTIRTTCYREFKVKRSDKHNANFFPASSSLPGLEPRRPKIDIPRRSLIWEDPSNASVTDTHTGPCSSFTHYLESPRPKIDIPRSCSTGKDECNAPATDSQIIGSSSLPSAFVSDDMNETEIYTQHSLYSDPHQNDRVYSNEESVVAAGLLQETVYPCEQHTPLRIIDTISPHEQRAVKHPPHKAVISNDKTIENLPPNTDIPLTHYHQIDKQHSDEESIDSANLFKESEYQREQHTALSNTCEDPESWYFNSHFFNAFLKRLGGITRYLHLSHIINVKDTQSFYTNHPQNSDYPVIDTLPLDDQNIDKHPPQEIAESNDETIESSPPCNNIPLSDHHQIDKQNLDEEYVHAADLFQESLYPCEQHTPLCIINKKDAKGSHTHLLLNSDHPVIDTLPSDEQNTDKNLLQEAAKYHDKSIDALSTNSDIPLSDFAPEPHIANGLQTRTDFEQSRKEDYPCISSDHFSSSKSGHPLPISHISEDTITMDIDTLILQNKRELYINRKLVVHVDGSIESMAALEWASRYFGVDDITLLASHDLPPSQFVPMINQCRAIRPQARVYIEQLTGRSNRGPSIRDQTTRLRATWFVLGQNGQEINALLEYCFEKCQCMTFGVKKERDCFIINTKSAKNILLGKEDRLFDIENADVIGEHSANFNAISHENPEPKSLLPRSSSSSSSQSSASSLFEIQIW